VGAGVAEVLLIDYDALDLVAELKNIVARRKPSDLNRIDIMQRENKYPRPPLDESLKWREMYYQRKVYLHFQRRP
jgi:hypothetical protein